MSGPENATAPTADVVVRSVVATSLAGSALVHATVMPEHFGEWAPAGVFFLVLMIVEAGLAALAVWRWGRPVALLVVLSGLATIGVWVVSRTAGVPIGPAEFRVPEAVGRPDVVCCALELFAALVSLVFLLRPASLRSRGRAGRGTTLLAVGLGGAALALAVFGAAPVLAGESEHDHGHHHHHEDASAAIEPAASGSAG